MRRWTILCVACFSLAIASVLQAARVPYTEQELEEDHSLSTQLITPHKPWAKGYAKGPLRAMFIVNPGSYGGTWCAPETRLREVVELAQRFDLRPDAIFYGGSKGNEFMGLELGKRRAARLLEKPYDVYVFANIAMAKFPVQFQYAIMEQVAKGAGLVCCGQAATEFMLTKRLITPTPSALVEGLPLLDGKAAREVVKAYRLGKGRGVWLNYSALALTPNLEFSYRGLAEYDYRMLLVGRALLWAASRESDVSITSAFPEKAEFTLINNAAQPIETKCALELRRACDAWKKDLGESALTLAPGQPVRLPVSLPKLRAGDYFVDVVVKSSRGVEACGAGSLEIKSDFGVEKVEMSAPFVERGEQINGKILLRGTPPPDAVIRLRFRDSYDRVLVQRDIKVAPGQMEYAFDYRPDAFATILMRVEAVLMTGGEEIQMADTSFTVPKRRRGQFNFLQWDSPRDVLGYYAWRKMQEAGQYVCLVGSFAESKPWPLLLACDVSLVPYSTRILDPKDENGYMKPCCWNDEPKVTEHVQKIVNNQQKRREHGVFVYSLGDEGVTLGCCVHPACIAAYRRYLAAQYGSIEKFNESWGTQYKSFDEVDLLDRKDNMENAAVTKKMYARWYDRQAFARYNLMQFSGRFVKEYLRLDPQAVTGFEGTGGFGDDYDAILSINTFYTPYPGIGDDIIRSAAPRDFIRANWMGYSKTADALSDAAWRMVIKGMDSVWYWMWTGIGSWRGYLTPTLDFAPAIAELSEEMRPVRRGLGDLLLNSKMTHSGIAVFYSLPSALSGNLENGREFIGPQQTHETWTRLTYELGLDFRYLTSAMLKRGVLDTKEFKVVLLLMTQAIAPEEAAAIERFVQAGGVAIADIRPGIYDGHCKPMLPGVLDDLFGIKRTGRGKVTRVDVSLKCSLLGQVVEFQSPGLIADSEVQALTADVLARTGDVPFMLHNQVNKGHAILLNFQPLSSEKPNDAQAVEARKLLKALYVAAGVKPVITVTAPDGSPLPLTETRVWQNGDALVFGLWRQMKCEWFSPTKDTVAGEPVAAKITLPTARHVYDLRAGKYLGVVTEINTLLRWGRANFFLALPYEIRDLEMTLSSNEPFPGQPLTATIRFPVPPQGGERFAVYLEVTDPQGQQPLWGRQVLILHGGVGQTQIPIAYNDTVGTWKIRATELFSNKTVEATWNVSQTQ